MRLAVRLAVWQAVALTVHAAPHASNASADCSPSGEDCTSTRCCQDPLLACYQKNQYWASCNATCSKGVNENDPPDSQTPWTCNLLTPIPESTGDWQSGLYSSHFWDCNGAGCDATVLQPFKKKKFIYAPEYAPTDPADHGGSAYGEKLWMTGAASDDLAALLGPNACCGADKKSKGGCGQCLLVRNPTALNADWTAVVMKKSRCPPESNGCQAGFVHMDFAVPGYDLLGESTANVCGNPKVANTFITKAESSLCSQNLADGVDSVNGCNCSSLPEASPEQRLLKQGCQLFSAWGWTSGDPVLEFQHVDCPPAFVAYIGDSFGPGGVGHAPKIPWMWILIGVALPVVACCVGAVVAQQLKERRRAQKPPPRRMGQNRAPRFGAEALRAAESGSSSESDE